VLREEAAEGALRRPVEDHADVAAVRRGRRDQHGLAVVEVAEQRMRDEDHRLVLGSRRRGERRRSEREQHAKHGSHAEQYSEWLARSVRAPLACATSSAHIAEVSPRNASASVARSTNQLPLSISASSCRGAQPEKPA